MAEQFEGPVRVARGGRETVVDGSTLLVGREIPASGGPIATNPDAILVPGEVLVDPSSTIDSGPLARLIVGDEGAKGAVTVIDREAHATISLIGGFGTFGTGREAGGVTVRGANNGPVILITGENGRITFLDARLRTKLTIDGTAGDITFSGADCAEDFDVVDDPVAGSVMSLDENGSLRCSSSAYDTRVAGVVSGAGGYLAALRLGRKPGAVSRVPIALVGRVYCLAEADSEPIGVGHLLTTSATPGHAMRASDSRRSFGAVLGKSLGTLQQGRGLIPMLVALQ